MTEETLREEMWKAFMCTSNEVYITVRACVDAVQSELCHSDCPYLDCGFTDDRENMEFYCSLFQEFLDMTEVVTGTKSRKIVSRCGSCAAYGRPANAEDDNPEKSLEVAYQC